MSKGEHRNGLVFLYAKYHTPNPKRTSTFSTQWRAGRPKLLQVALLTLIILTIAYRAPLFLATSSPASSDTPA